MPSVRFGYFTANDWFWDICLDTGWINHQETKRSIPTNVNIIAAIQSSVGTGFLEPVFCL